MTKRIRKKRSLLYDAQELRDYLTGKERVYPMWRLQRLCEWGPPRYRHVSLYRARRFVRERDRREMEGMKKMIVSLTKDSDEIVLSSSGEPEVGHVPGKGDDALFNYGLLLSYR